ncbi:MAG: 50S ribosomal protein L29 [Gemmatimonadetes bacterium]|nr:50S ribosomal protein L29 [Gemmatimonadota bacterium]
MRPEEIREMTDQEMQAKLKELKEELFRLRFRSATMDVENPTLLPKLRRDIARLKTILRERELAAGKK